jgi:hypothetical protein
MHINWKQNMMLKYKNSLGKKSTKLKVYFYYSLIFWESSCRSCTNPCVLGQNTYNKEGKDTLKFFNASRLWQVALFTQLTWKPRTHLINIHRIIFQ